MTMTVWQVKRKFQKCNTSIYLSVYLSICLSVWNQTSFTKKHWFLSLLAGLLNNKSTWSKMNASHKAMLVSICIIGSIFFIFLLIIIVLNKKKNVVISYYRKWRLDKQWGFFQPLKIKTDVLMQSQKILHVRYHDS